MNYLGENGTSVEAKLEPPKKNTSKMRSLSPMVKRKWVNITTKVKAASRFSNRKPTHQNEDYMKIAQNMFRNRLSYITYRLISWGLWVCWSPVV